MNIKQNLYFFPGISVDYDSYYPCRSNYDCCANDYCRCMQITNPRVSIEYAPLIKALGIEKEEPLQAYCYDRFLVLNGILEPDNYSVSVTKGYYGEEIAAVYFTKPLELKDLTIEDVLLSEYGHILDQLKDLAWKVIKVKKSDLIFGQKDHYYKLDTKRVKMYDNDLKIPKGIVTQEGEKYRIYDGYHRLSANKKNFKVVCGEKI